MSSISILQGAVAGGTAAYLHDRVNTEASIRSTDTWTSVALQVNHLFWLICETFQAASIPLGGLVTLVRVTYILTPLIFFSSFDRQKITDTEAICARQFNRVYQVGVITASVATLVLGNPLFAMASLSMLATDALIAGKAKEIFAYVRKAAAILAVIGYSAQIFAGRSLAAGFAQVTTVVMMIKLFVWDFLPKFPTWNRSPTYVPQRTYTVVNPSTPPVVIVQKPPKRPKPPVVVVQNPYTTPPPYAPVFQQTYVPQTPSAPPPPDDEPISKPEPSVPQEPYFVPPSFETPEPSPLVRETDLWSSTPTVPTFETPVPSPLVRETGVW